MPLFGALCVFCIAFLGVSARLAADVGRHKRPLTGFVERDERLQCCQRA